MNQPTTVPHLVTIETEFPGWNQLRKMHWSEYTRKKKALTTTCWAIIKSQLGSLKIDEPVFCAFYHQPTHQQRKQHLKDGDNAAAFVHKCFFDGLQAAGVLANDTTDEVPMKIDLHGPPIKRQKVHVQIWPMSRLADFDFQAYVQIPL